MKPLPVWLSLVLGLSPLAATAQRGDRATEVQAAPDAGWVIPPAPVLSPAEAATSFHLPAGFRVELIAAEPLVQDPVSLAWGADGRLWVVEMTGYMRDVDGTGAHDPIGNVVVLSDADNDGRFDRRTVFMAGLILPRAIALVDDGILVAEPPNLLFVRDTNGDGRGDAKVVVANDYGTDVENVEHLPNGLLWALDNWIYSANHDVRFRYEGGGQFRREPTLMRGQWGITQDDLGRLFYNSNSDPLRVDLLPAEDLERNAAFTARGARVPVVPRTLRVWPGRITTGINRGYRTLDAEGKMYAVTAACGPVIYRGQLFPEEMSGDAFVAEPAGHLIKRIALTEGNGEMVGANAYEGTEFMTSTDERFRPVNLFNGPDGALWVVDMYRGFIQDRRFLTTYLRRQVLERKLDKPTGLGRIWRIVPDRPVAAAAEGALAQSAPHELVDALDHTNGWTRDTAQRLLVERRSATRESSTLAALREKAVRGAAPLGRLHALWTLEGCDALDVETLSTALDDPDVRVVAAAIRLAGQMSDASGAMSLGNRLAELASRRNEPALRLQLALSLGNYATPSAQAAMRRLVTVADAQPYLADAVVSGLAGREAAFVEELVRDPAAAQCAETLKLATSAILRRGDRRGIERAFLIAADQSRPAEVRHAVLDGVQYFLPRASGAQPAIGRIPALPDPLRALAQGDEPDFSTRAAELLERLEWPGKVGASMPARPLSPGEQELFQKGQAQYAALCAACHQAGGQGLPGLAPALVNSKWVVGDAELLARIVLDGKTRENLVMPAWKSLLNDESLAAVLTFLRRSWGHQAEPVPTGVVARARRLSARREEPWTDEQLEHLQTNEHAQDDTGS